MFRRLLHQLQEFGDFIDWLLRLGAVVAVVSPIIISIRQWIELDTIDLWLLGISLFGLLLIGASIALRWQKNRSVKRIPDLLSRMDEKMKCLIGIAEQPEHKLEQFAKDISELWDIDIQRIQIAYTSKNITDLKAMVKEWETKPSPFPQSSSQPFSIVSNFLQTLFGLMKTDDIGTDSIKDPEYRKLEKQLQTLKTRLRDSRSIRNLDRYLMWWNGSNHFWLFSHYGRNNPMYPLVAPAKVKAIIPQFEYLLQVAVNEYLGYVKDSIYGKGEVKEEWKPIINQ